MTDGGATGALAAIAWLNGVQRVPAGALVLRRTLLGRWVPADLVVRSTRWQVVAWWPPLTASVVRGADRRAADTAASARGAAKQLDVRLRRIRPWWRALRALGALELTALVAGVPWAATRFGAWGLGVGCAVVLLLAAITSAAAAFAFRRVGDGRGAALRAALPLLSPFAAPRAADALLERVVADSPPELVARALLSPEEFAALIRPRAYDAQRGSGAAADESAPSLITLFGARYIASVVDTPPPGCVAGERYCPRCGIVYHERVAACDECAGVPLVVPAAA
jgi:hypothetical protein